MPHSDLKELETFRSWKQEGLHVHLQDKMEEAVSGLVRDNIELACQAVAKAAATQAKQELGALLQCPRQVLRTHATQNRQKLHPRSHMNEEPSRRQIPVSAMPIVKDHRTPRIHINCLHGVPGMPAVLH